MKATIISVALALALGGLGQQARAESYPADNTGKNVRDRDGGTQIVIPTDAVLAACDACDFGVAFLP